LRALVVLKRPKMRKEAGGNYGLRRRPLTFAPQRMCPTGTDVK